MVSSLPHDAMYDYLQESEKEELVRSGIQSSSSTDYLHYTDLGHNNMMIDTFLYFKIDINENTTSIDSVGLVQCSFLYLLYRDNVDFKIDEILAQTENIVIDVFMRNTSMLVLSEHTSSHDSGWAFWNGARKNFVNEAIEIFFSSTMNINDVDINRSQSIFLLAIQRSCAARRQHDYSLQFQFEDQCAEKNMTTNSYINSKKNQDSSWHQRQISDPNVFFYSSSIASRLISILRRLTEFQITCFCEKKSGTELMIFDSLVQFFRTTKIMQKQGNLQFNNAVKNPLTTQIFKEVGISILHSMLEPMIVKFKLFPRILPHEKNSFSGNTNFALIKALAKHCSYLFGDVDVSRYHQNLGEEATLKLLLCLARNGNQNAILELVNGYHQHSS